jgi:hypothetical protein
MQMTFHEHKINLTAKTKGIDCMKGQGMDGGATTHLAYNLQINVLLIQYGCQQGTNEGTELFHCKALDNKHLASLYKH